MNEKHFAYIDRGGIMHVSKNAKTARQYKARGHVIVTDFPAMHGFPVVDGEEIIVYGPEEMRLDAKGDCIEPVPELAELYKLCEG